MAIPPPTPGTYPDQPLGEMPRLRGRREREETSSGLPTPPYSHYPTANARVSNLLPGTPVGHVSSRAGPPSGPPLGPLPGPPPGAPPGPAPPSMGNGYTPSQFGVINPLTYYQMGLFPGSPPGFPPYSPYPTMPSMPPVPAMTPPQHTPPNYGYLPPMHGGPLLQSPYAAPPGGYRAMSPSTGMYYGPGFAYGGGYNGDGYDVPAYYPTSSYEARRSAYYDGYQEVERGREPKPRHRSKGHESSGHHSSHHGRHRSRSRSGSVSSSESEKSSRHKKRSDGEKIRAALTGALTGVMLEKGYEKLRDHNKKGGSAKGDDH